MLKTVVMNPRLSEKSYGLSDSGVYVFNIPLVCSKLTVKRAIEVQYDVTVKAVRTVISKGKTKRVVRKRQRPILGRRSDFKKAYVTLKEGDKIAVFPEGN